MKQVEIDPRAFDLYDEYCHLEMSRREFLERVGAIMLVGGPSAMAVAQALLPRYAQAQQISFTDPRITPQYVDFDSPGGISGRMRGYLVRENLGPKPHIEDAARRMAVKGFLTLAPDGLSPVGGYLGNDDAGKALQRSLDRDELLTALLNSARFLKAHPLSSGRRWLPDLP